MLVKTALVRIKSPSGLEKTVRIMSDEISEKTWIRKGLADERRLDGTKEAVVVITFGQKVKKPFTSLKFEFYLADKEGNNWVKVKAIAVDDVGAPVSAVRVTPGFWPHLEKIKFVDSYPRGIQTADVLTATTEPKVLGPEGTPGASKTTLGWILCGSLNEVQGSKETRIMIVQIPNEDLNKKVTRLFEVEAMEMKCSNETAASLRDREKNGTV